jgi:hypothetical protein
MEHLARPLLSSDFLKWHRKHRFFGTSKCRPAVEWMWQEEQWSFCPSTLFSLCVLWVNGRRVP